MRRIKLLKFPLPCTTLLTKLVKPEMMPFACNITLTLLDIALQNEPHERRQDCTAAILTSMELFYPIKTGDKDSKVFTLQMNSLVNYSLEMLSHIPVVIESSFKETLALPLFPPSFSCRRTTQPPHHLALLWDFLLDLCLVQAPLVKGTLGSVQPGLSTQRVERLCHRPRKRDNSSDELISGWFMPSIKEVRFRNIVTHCHLTPQKIIRLN